MELRDFTPAQTLMITQPFGISGKDLMKYSLLDLVFKGVLSVHKEWRQVHPREPRERLYTLVSRGNYFDTYGPSFHQDPFIDPFKKDNYEYQVRIVAKKVYKESGKGAGFKSNRVYKQLKNEGYFGTSMGLKYLNLFFLNGKGLSLKRKFKSILNEAEKSLPQYAKSNSAEAKKILQTLGSNVLLLDCFNDELIHSLKPIFAELEGSSKTFLEESFDDEGDMFEFLFWTFIDGFESFDSSFDSFDSNLDFGGSDFGSDFGGGDFGGD